MFRRKRGEIVHLAIDDDPAVVCSCVLVDLSDRYLGVRHLKTVTTAMGRGRFDFR